MGGWPVLVGVVSVVLLAAASLLAAGRTVAPALSVAATGDAAPALADPVRRTRGRTTAARLIGLVVGMIAAVAMLSAPAWTLGLGAALAAPTFALCLLAGVIVGELFGRAPAGVTRTAVLEVRSVPAFLPTRLATAVAATGVVLVALLLTTSLVASADDQGRSGRALAMACGPGSQASITPWPGSFYAGPIAAAILIGLVLAAVGLHVVAARPRPRPDEPGRRADDQLRRTSGRAITAGVGVLVAAPLAGVALFTAHALETIGCAPTALRVLGLAMFAVAAGAVVATAAFAVGSLLPAERVRS
jgi:hypothetical protein